jgi:hypothetical protein
MRRPKIKSKDRNKRKSGTKKGNRVQSKRTIAADRKTEVELDLKVPADFMEARKNIATLVRVSVNEIAARFMADAKAGQVAPAKYLFEVVGLYPATAETSASPDNSLAYALLKRMGLPTEPVICEEDRPMSSTEAKAGLAGTVVVGER